MMDFFSGSGTTAHALMKYNAENGKNCRFVMVQLPEKTKEEGTSYKAGYKNICEIGRERIRRAGTKLKEESSHDLDIGFRVLKLDDSNMNDVYYSPAEYSQSLLSMLESNVKSDRTDLDLVVFLNGDFHCRCRTVQSRLTVAQFTTITMVISLPALMRMYQIELLRKSLRDNLFVQYSVIAVLRTVRLRLTWAKYSSYLLRIHL